MGGERDTQGDRACEDWAGLSRDRRRFDSVRHDPSMSLGRGEGVELSSAEERETQGTRVKETSRNFGRFGISGGGYASCSGRRGRCLGRKGSQRVGSTRGTSRRDGLTGDVSPESIERRGRRTRDSDQGGIGSKGWNSKGKTNKAGRVYRLGSCGRSRSRSGPGVRLRIGSLNILPVRRGEARRGVARSVEASKPAETVRLGVQGHGGWGCESERQAGNSRRSALGKERRRD